MALPPKDPPKPPKPVKDNQEKNRDRNRKQNKNAGLHEDEDFTVKGIKVTKTQIKLLERILDQAAKDNAPNDAVKALLMTGIAESGIREVMNEGGTKYGGVFQGDIGGGVFKVDETEKMAHYCLVGGKGFNGKGGLIGLVKANKNATEPMSLETMCVTNQGNRANFPTPGYPTGESFFNHDVHGPVDQYPNEADDIITAYNGGFTGGTSYHRGQYNFRIGDEENPHESYWHGMVRLADEVHWRLFTDGRTVYFDSDMTLIKQKPAAIIDRHDPAVLSWNATWDKRKIATEMTLDLICEPFQFRAGEVLKLRGFGPISNGSTAKPKAMPGRWLISEITRSSGSYVSSFTLIQPRRERREPPTEMIADEDEKVQTGGSLRDIKDGELNARDVIEEIVLKIGRAHKCKTPYGLALTADNVYAANLKHNKYVHGRPGVVSDHYPAAPDKRYAVDMCDQNNSGGPDQTKLALAMELSRVFDMGWRRGLVNKSYKGYELQLIYLDGGDHQNHVHFGVQNNHPLTLEELNANHGWGYSADTGGV